jgi:hypothetical protein
VALARHPYIHLWHLNISPSTAPRCRISRSQVSVTRKWQLALRRHLLHIGCPPSVLVPSVQGLTDHPCCAAGSSENQNHNTEEHLDTKCAIVCVTEMLSALNVKCGLFSNLHGKRQLTIRYRSCAGLPYERPGSGSLLFCRHVLSLCFMTRMIVPRTYLRFATLVSLRGSSKKVKVSLTNMKAHFTMTFGTNVTAELSTVRTYSTLPPWKLLRIIFRWRSDARQGYSVRTELADLRIIQGPSTYRTTARPRESWCWVLYYSGTRINSCHRNVNRY